MEIDRSFDPRSDGEPPIDALFREMIERSASDLHLTMGERPRLRLHGQMTQMDLPPLTPARMAELLWPICSPKNRKEFESYSDTDFAYEMPGFARFRCNYFMDRTGMGAVFRQIPTKIPTMEQLGLPKEIVDLCWLSKGFVVVTGPTGSGKSTTLSALINHINENRSDHIITIEDPIEFVHQNKKCLLNQREIGTHTMGFKRALRAALREDPDIVLVGEMRDLETIGIAIETAETGHLVFGTLHTTTAPSTVDRIIDQFPTDRQTQIRVMLSEALKGVIAQTLCRKIGGGRIAAYEVLIVNTAVSNLIREGKTFQIPSLMQTQRNIGMRTLNDSLFELVKNKLVEPKEAYVKAVDKTALVALYERGGIRFDPSRL
jgi:twitching motility protein PilT